MRVIHIVHGKANPQGHNGISRVVYHLNKNEKRLGINSEIWALVDHLETYEHAVRDAHVSVECFPRVRLPIGKHEIVDRLRAEAASIDIVHMHLIWFYDKNVIAAALAKYGIPFIITTHGTYSSLHARTGKRLIAKYLYETAFLNMASEIHALTREERSALITYGYKGRAFVVPNGMDLEEMPEASASEFYAHKSYAKKVKVIWVGVLRADKNLEALVRAVFMLPKEIRKSFVCVLVGPDYKDNARHILSLAADLGCAESIDYLGPLYGTEKYDAIRSSDAYVVPSFSEGVSLAMLDGMACGKPGLVTSGCGFRYFMNHDFVVPCEPNAEDICEGIQELLRRRADWGEMGRRAKDLIENVFSWSTIARTMIENYSRIVRGTVR